VLSNWSLRVFIIITVKKDVKMVRAHYLRTINDSDFIFNMLVSLSEYMAPFGFVFTKSKVKVTRDTFASRMVNDFHLIYQEFLHVSLRSGQTSMSQWLFWIFKKPFPLIFLNYYIHVKSLHVLIADYFWWAVDPLRFLVY